MSDPERPKGPTAASFEVPDLDLGVLSQPGQPARSVRSPSGGGPVSARSQQKPSEVAPSMFDEDAFTSGSAAIQLSDDAPYTGGAAPSAYMGGEIDLGLGADDFELEPSAGYTAPSSSGVQSVRRAAAGDGWPTGKPLAPEQVPVDSVEVDVLAGYGDAPGALLAPLYTYRVLTRRRELQRMHAQTEAERARAELERERALAALAEHVRAELEKSEAFRRLLEPLGALEQLANERERALSSTNAEYAAALGGYDAELAKVAAALAAEGATEAAKQSDYDEREERNKRAEAKLKRVQIEVRALNQVIQQKLGPQGGRIPPEDKLKLEELDRRALALQPDVDQTRNELALTKRELDELHARLDGLRRTERQLNRQKQALAQQFDKQLETRSQGQSDAQARRRKALAEIGVAVLGMRGGVTVAKDTLDAVRTADKNADFLQLRGALEQAALGAYHKERFKQGFLVVLGALAVIALWIAFKVLASSSSAP